MNIVKIYHVNGFLEIMILQIIFLSGVTLFAYFTKGLTGFGNTLVMNSLFSFLKENRFTTPVDLLLGIPSNVYLAWQNRQNIHWGIVIPLSLAVILGNIPGILLLSIASDHFLKIILGIILLVLSIEMLIRKTNHGAQAGRPALLWLVGTASGILMGLFGIGALLAVYINRYTKNRSDYRGNLCWVFVVDNVIRFFGYWWRGILDIQVVKFTIFLAPAAIAGMWLSRIVDLHLSESLIHKFILILLVSSGMLLIINNAHT
jgi:Predicted permeases